MININNYKEKTIMSNAFYEKQMILNRLHLPQDIIDYEIKEFCFHDNVSSKALNVRRRVNTLIVSALSSRMSCDNEHWIFGYVSDDGTGERLQLQALLCARCGNYRTTFSDFHNYSTQSLSRVICNCYVH